jgi:hypothetical protein
VVIFDSSTDPEASKEMARFANVVRVPHSEVPSNDGGLMSEAILLRIRNEAYKASRGSADWVVIADIDEFVYHPDFLGRLRTHHAAGVSVIEAQGFEMVSDRAPSGSRQIFEQITRGFLNPYYSKCAVFRPFVDIRYSPGCHSCTPSGPGVVFARDASIKLLHYRFLGQDYFTAKYLARQSRLSKENLDRGWATHLTVPGPAGSRALYPTDSQRLKERYAQILSQQHVVEVVRECGATVVPGDGPLSCQKGAAE